jgi:hypothetical protein
VTTGTAHTPDMSEDPTRDSKEGVTQMPDKVTPKAPKATEKAKSSTVKKTAATKTSIKKGKKLPRH